MSKRGGALACILAFAPPMLAAQLSGALFPLLARAFVAAQGGRRAAAALSLATPLLALPRGAAMLGACGGGAAEALSRGRGDRAACARNAGAGLLLGCALTALCSALLLLLSPALLALFGAEEELLPQAARYLRIAAASAPLYAAGLALQRALLSRGRPWRAAAVSLLALAANLAADALLVPRLGLSGAALGGAAGDGVSLAVGLLLAGRGCSARPGRAELSAVLRLGLPQGFQQLCAAAAQVAAARAGALAGTDTLASLGAAMTVQNLLSMPASGLNQGASPAVGYATGARRGELSRRLLRAALLLSFLFSLPLWTLLLAFPDAVAGLIGAETGRGLRLFCAAAPLFFASSTASNYFLASGRPRRALLLSATRSAALMVPAFLLLSGALLFHVGWVNDVASFLLALFLILAELRAKSKPASS